MNDQSRGTGKRTIIALAALLALALSACSGGGKKAPQPPQGPQGPTPVTVSGVAAKGLLLNAVVNFYEVTNGTVGTTSIASTRTNATTGAFSSPVASNNPVVVTITADANTTMLDELSGSAIPAPAGLRLRAALPSLANLQTIAVTPLSEMAVSIASSATGGLTGANINSATTAVSSALLGAASLNTAPIDIRNYANAPVDQQQLSKLLTALAVAASQGSATSATGTPCDSTVGDYGQRVVCMIGGLGRLLSLGAGNAGTLQTDANYIRAAYTQINSGDVTVAGGQAPSALGLTAPTNAETAFVTAVATQAALAGYDSNGAPLPTTKALFADIRTNIIDQSSTQTFGLAPVAANMADDLNNNVAPVVQNGASALAAIKMAAALLGASHTDPAAGEPTSLVAPNGIARGADGTLYVSSGFADAVLKVSPAGEITVFAGLAGAPGSADGTGSAARFAGPRGLALDAAGNVFVADTTNHTIREITPAGVVTTLAGQAGTPGNLNGVGTAALFNLPFGLALDAGGNLYVSELGNPQQVRKIAPDGTVTTFATGVANLTGGLTVDSSGNVYATDLAAPRIRVITPAGVVSTLAGAGVPGSSDGVGAAAGFRLPLAVSVGPTGLVFVADTGNNNIRVVLSNGLVATIANTAAIAGNLDGAPADARFRAPGGLVIGADGNLYVSDGGNNSIRVVNPAGVSTLAHGAAAYRHSAEVICGYDPPRLSAGDKTMAACRYGGVQNPIALTLTDTGNGTFHVTTQPLTGAFNPAPPLGADPVFLTYTRSTTLAALDAAYTETNGTGNAFTAAASGPVYVTAAGGQATVDVSVAAADGWDESAGSGAVTLGGTLNGNGSLAHVTLGPDSTLTLTNLGALEGVTLPAGAAVPSAQASLAVDAVTSGYAYGARFTVAPPTADKSGTIGLPATVSFSGGVASVGAGGVRSPLFTGNIVASVTNIPDFDFTMPISATNTLDAQLQIDGKLVLTGGRELTVLTTFSGRQDEPTPDNPFSVTATYSYVTPKGTAQLNVTAHFDTTSGLTASINNNAGVTVSLARPAGSATIDTLTGTAVANNVQTATIAGATIQYSDGSSESLF